MIPQENYLPKAILRVDGTWQGVGGIKLKTKAPFVTFYVETQIVNTTKYPFRAICQINANSKVVGLAMGQDLAPGDNLNVGRLCIYAPGFIPGDITINIHANGIAVPGMEHKGLEAVVHKTKIMILSEV